MYSVEPGDFNKNAKNRKYIRSSHPKHKSINDYIENKISRAKSITADLEKNGKLVTAQVVKSLMIEPASHDFLVFADAYIADLKVNNNIGTYKKYTAVLNSIKGFHESPTLLFEEIDNSFLNKYQSQLKKEGKEQTTIHGYLSKLRSFFNKAIEAGIIEQNANPFAKYKLKLGRPNKDRLNIKEIVLIEELNLTKESILDHVRNVFLFSFYNAGIRISDILLLKWDSVQDGRLVYIMYKTKKTHSLKLKEKPLAILDKYKGTGESFIFPFLSDRYDYSDPMFLHNQIGSKTALINKYLKELGKLAGINKKITTHTARHSFADIARQKTDNIYNLSKTIGHSSIKVTEAYLPSFDENAVDDTLDSVIKI
jgi:site-specific recombinase XerD